ncbi:MAG: hypothetical protein ABSB65_13060 [Candidatus Acidiferrales bacterium]|jgi:hypothetical protein
MKKQPRNSPAHKALEDFMGRFCPPDSSEADRFIGFKIRDTDVLYKKGKNCYQLTKGAEYPIISFAKKLCPYDLTVKPSYILCHSTDSPKSHAVKALGEKLFFMRTSELEEYLGCAIESKSGGFVITLTLPKNRRFLDSEISEDALKARLRNL